jgi:HemY protein
MKKSFLILIAVALALLAAAIAPVFKTDPGMVQVHFRGWTIETSVLILVLAVLALWLLVWVLVRLWKMPAETARHIRDRRSLAQLEKGLLALTEGDWSTAERALEKSASSHGRTTARYLAAAEAADGQDAGDRAEWYLEQADTRNRKQKFLVDLTRARILTQNAHYAEARRFWRHCSSAAAVTLKCWKCWRVVIVNSGNGRRCSSCCQPCKKPA